MALCFGGAEQRSASEERHGLGAVDNSLELGGLPWGQDQPGYQESAPDIIRYCPTSARCRPYPACASGCLTHPLQWLAFDLPDPIS